MNRSDDPSDDGASSRETSLGEILLYVFGFLAVLALLAFAAAWLLRR